MIGSNYWNKWHEDKEAILHMARELGLTIREHYDESGSTPAELERFFQAAYIIGVEAEREACANICFQMVAQWTDDQARSAASECSVAIRARGNK